MTDGSRPAITSGADEARAGSSSPSLLEHPSVRDLGDRMASIGMWLYLPETDESVWSPNFTRMLGYEPGEIAPSVERFLDHVHPGDREMVLNSVGTVAGAIEYRIVRRDRAVRVVRASAGGRPPEGLDGRECIVGVLQDITDHNRADALVNVHVAVSRALSRWKSLGSSGPDLLRAVAEALGCMRGSIWVERDGALVVGTLWYRAGVPPELELIRQVRLRPGEGVAGQVWRLRRPVYVDRPNDPLLDRFRGFGLDSVQAVLGLPLLAADEVLAVLVLVADQDIYVAAQDIVALNGIAHELGQFFAHRRGELRPTLLSRRELELLQSAADGMSGPRIASHLFIERSTVKSHFEHIYAKLGVSDRAAAVAEGLRLGLVR